MHMFEATGATLSCVAAQHSPVKTAIPHDAEIWTFERKYRTLTTWRPAFSPYRSSRW